MAPVSFNNTFLRDGHEPLAATRMTTAQMPPAAGPLDALGFGALGTWGGATINAALRFLHEHPFERLSRLKAAAPRTPQMMLLSGQNLVQYASFPDDVVEAFVACAARQGLDVFRVFDALNDTRNLRSAIRAMKAAGQLGILCTVLLALALGFPREQAVTVAMIGACDDPSGIYVSNLFAAAGRLPTAMVGSVMATAILLSVLKGMGLL